MFSFVLRKNQGEKQIEESVKKVVLISDSSRDKDRLRWRVFWGGSCTDGAMFGFWHLTAPSSEVRLAVADCRMSDQYPPPLSEHFSPGDNSVNSAEAQRSKKQRLSAALAKMSMDLFLFGSLNPVWHFLIRKSLPGYLFFTQTHTQAEYRHGSVCQEDKAAASLLVVFKRCNLQLQGFIGFKWIGRRNMLKKASLGDRQSTHLLSDGKCLCFAHRADRADDTHLWIYACNLIIYSSYLLKHFK